MLCLYANRWALNCFRATFFVFVFKTVRASHAIIAHLLHTCSFFLSVCLPACRRVNLNIIQANTHIVQCSFCIFWNHADAHASIWAAENKIESRLYNLPLCHCNWDWESEREMEMCGQRQSKIYNARFWIFHLIWKVHTRIWLHVRQHFMDSII